MVYRHYSAVIFLCVLVVMCIISDARAEPLHNRNDSDTFTQFENPQAVDIHDLPYGAGGRPVSTEEPFVSRDSRFLFFNTGTDENNKDLHYAEWMHTRWVYRGPIGPHVNTPKDVQGNATMDNAYTFLYTDSSTETMARMAHFSAETGKLTSIRDFTGVPKRQVSLVAQTVSGNMGVEMSADGTVVYFSRATWKLNGLTIGRILESDIFFTTKKGGTYVYDDKEAQRVMRRINTSDLEYAASISSDGLEIFFTRLALADLQAGTIRSTIMRSTRDSVSEAFSKSAPIAAIGSFDFVEGPTISGDGKELYYHKREGDRFRLYKVVRGIEAQNN